MLGHNGCPLRYQVAEIFDLNADEVIVSQTTLADISEHSIQEVLGGTQGNCPTPAIAQSISLRKSSLHERLIEFSWQWPKNDVVRLKVSGPSFA